MRLQNILQGDYTASSFCYQIKLPLNLELSIPADDPVRLVSAFVEEMDLTGLYATYDRIRKNQASPRQMLKIVIYAAMNRIYSSRDIEKSCRRDINFMYLLEGLPTPDHATIARFISIHLSACAKELMSKTDGILLGIGEISGENIFIDGTKIESAANKYTFVWKKAVTKNCAKLLEKAAVLVAECEEQYGVRIVYGNEISLHTLKRLRKAIYRIKKSESVEFVHGIGKKKSGLQKNAELLDEYLNRLKDYTDKLHKCGERNSFSKTDVDATFMQMKEDAMLNGQLKPAYNLQHGVDSEYVTWVDVFHNPTDTKTLIPFLKDMNRHLNFRYQNIVADAGYESEENYIFIENNGQVAFIKPANYEISKTRKYRTDIGRRENMEYDEKGNFYTCRDGRRLVEKYIKHEKTETGYKRAVTVYACESCAGCPPKTECIKGNNCKALMSERNKALSVSRVMEQKRKEDLERITSDFGTQLRMNRSIQAEGSFANVKEDMGFRRYLYRGKPNVLAESILIAIAFDMNRLHNRIQSGRIGLHLFELKKGA